jgi:hypothetical protein
MFKTVPVSFLCLAFLSVILTDCFARPPRAFAEVTRRPSDLEVSEQPPGELLVSANDYQSDIARLIELRSHPLEELLALANQLEVKWRGVDWNSYARVMQYVCSEISNRGLNNPHVREQSEHFARIALSHSKKFLWELQADLVGALGYQRSSATDAEWLRERREKTEFWLNAWMRLEKQTDPSFDINDRKSLPRMRVFPPFETGLPAGTPPSAIKDPRLRAEYEAAIADNKRKSQRVGEQLPLQLHGPSFKRQTERWLIQAYSQPPGRITELKRFLKIYIKDTRTRERILTEIGKNSS